MKDKHFDKLLKILTDTEENLKRVCEEEINEGDYHLACYQLGFIACDIRKAKEILENGRED
jgi:hypothetical protein